MGKEIMPKGIYKRTKEMKTGKHMRGRKLSKKYCENIGKAHIGKHYNLGQIPWNKGKKGLQVCWCRGKKLSTKHRENLSNSHKGLVAWNKGLTGKKSHMYGKPSGMLGKTQSKKAREKIKKSPHKHHIYLKENDNKIMFLKSSIHIQLHYQAYRYIYKQYGKTGVDNYLRWFDKNFGLKLKDGNKKQIIVYCYACGDIIHWGHIRHFKKSKKYGDFLYVGVLSKSAIVEKKPPPLLPYKERARVIKSIKYVDKVICQTTYSPIPNILKIKPNIVVECSTHDKEDIKKIIKVVESYGGKVIIDPYYPEISSSEIKQKAKQK